MIQSASDKGGLGLSGGWSKLQVLHGLLGALCLANSISLWFETLLFRHILAKIRE